MNQELLTYIEQSPSMFHAAETTARLLSENGFTYLDESSNWTLVPGGKYYTTRNSSSLLAWRMPKGEFTGFMAMAAHSDSPFLKLKENAEQFDEHYVRLSVERYGSPLLAPWFDRPLSVAGRVLIRTKEGFTERLVDMAEPVAVIPSLAIHMNREANDKASYNMAVDMLPLIGERGDGVPDLRARIAEKLGIKDTDILTTELYMYNCQKGMVWSNYVSAPRLDDLQCAFAGVQGIIHAEDSASIPVYCLFDNEEVGSETRQGAASTFLIDLLDRICADLGLSGEERMHKMANSFMVSADNAHAVHPNHPEYRDPNNSVYMNKGVVIKYNARQSYASDAISAAVIRLICEQVDVPVQVYANRADLRGGSTLGHIATTQVSIPTVDIGCAQIAMHSCFETAGAEDTEYMARALTKYFSTALIKDENGYHFVE
ncbi:MAG: M18 family aminopeptidase [Oscillospiraceae bacterium]|nr:M18 family aminopeptidase [Oscillospiraceae bacterium]